MAKGTNSFITLISLILLFNAFIFISSSTVINYDNESERTRDETNPGESNDYVISFTNSIPNYLKVTVTPHEGLSTPTLCYSSTSAQCTDKRTVLAKRGDKRPAVAFIKKEEIQNKQFYIVVSCGKEACQYTFKVEGSNKCKIEDGTVYSYVVNDKNTEMLFEFYGKSTEYSMMNLGLEGSSSALLKLDDAYQEINIYQSVYDKAKFISYPLEKESNDTELLVAFKITGAKAGEFLRLSAYMYKHADEDYNAETFDNFLYPGGPTISGVLYRHQKYYEEICFPVSVMATDFKDASKFYLTGIIYSKYTDFWMADENEEYMGDTELEITDGLLFTAIESVGKKRSICFEFYGSYFEQDIKQSDVAFSISLVAAPFKKELDYYHVNPPQITGLTYPYILPKEKTLVYHGAQVETEKFDFFLYNRKGVVRMYVADCENYPECTFDLNDQTVVDKMEKVENSGKFLLYNGKNTKWEAFSKNKKVMVITCLDDGNDNKGYCEFDASIYDKGKTISLVPGQNLAQFIDQGQTGAFKILYKGALELLSVHVEIMIHSGEATFKGDFSPDYPTTLTEKLGQYATATTYLLGNKVFIYFDLKRYSYDSLYIKYKAIKNTYFTIKYHEFRADAKNEYLDEIIYPGESYLLSINPETNEKYTIAHVENNRYKTKRSFMTNFFALNCDFKVLTNKTQGETEITFADGYAQDVISGDDEKLYPSQYYNYKISIDKVEKSKYDKKMCMIYVAGYNTQDLYSSNSILIGNNVNQQIIFDKAKFKTVRFLYEHTDLTKSLIVYANIIDKAFYYIEIDIKTEENIYKRQVITRSYPYYIPKSEITKYCKDSTTFCNILVTVEYVTDTPGMSKTNPMVEITVREATPKGEDELLRVPTYLQKNIAKRDFVTGDGYYYVYTDIGEGDEGEVTINFLRDFGEVYGRIVQKDVRDKNEKNIEWLDLYRLPVAGWGDEDKFNGYLKKYQFTAEDTEDCSAGCYLIIGVRISQIGEWAEDWKFYPFSIVSLIGPNSASSADPIIVTIQVEEFIIGNVDISSNIKLKQFYQVWLPRDAEKIQIDWQSELAGLYINIGDERPITTANSDFALIPNGKDGIFEIPKGEIIEKAKEKKIDLPNKESLEDLHLIIGVWTEITDSADTELFSLRVREAGFYEDEETDYEVDVIQVSTDQKIMCKPIQVKDGFRCLFMITYDDQDVAQNMNLLVYSASTNLGAANELYANFLSARVFNEYNITELEKNVPSSGRCEFDSIRDNFNYLYIQLNERHKDQYLFVNVRADTADDIMMVASLNSYEIENKVQNYYANARTEQIVQVLEEKMIVNFPIEANLIVTIEDLGGEADLHWTQDLETVHYLRGKGDRVTLTTSTSYKQLTITKTASDKINNQGKDPGFVFMMYYYTRNPKINFDEVTYGNSIEIGYRKTDLPVFLYSKISDFTSDINLAVSFRDSHIDSEGEYSGAPVEVSAIFDTRAKIYSTKYNPDFVPSDGHTIYGYYDPAIKTAQVFISDVTIDTFNIDEKEHPTLLLFIAKSSDYKNKVYENFTIETQFTRTNSLVVPTEKVYNYGKYNGLVIQYYRLKVEKNKIMKIVLSFNGDELSWTLGNQGSKENDTSLNMDVKEARGKITITLKSVAKDFIFLNIFRTDPYGDPMPFLQNYVFKYINVQDESKYFDYKIKNDNGNITYKEETVDQKNTKITCTFNKIDTGKNPANITYFLKIIDATYYLGDKVKTIALSQTQYYTKYVRNPEDKNDKITISATGAFSTWAYLQVIAQIQQNKVLEFVAYEPVYMQRGVPEEEEVKKENTDNTGLFIGISVTLFVLIIGLVAVVFYFQQKNKSLLNQVKHVSFQQQGGSTADPDLLLAKNQGA